MRAVPFGLEDISRLAAATAAPFLPLLLTIFSPEELILRIIKVVFRRYRRQLRGRSLVSSRD